MSERPLPLKSAEVALQVSLTPFSNATLGPVRDATLPVRLTLVNVNVGRKTGFDTPER